MSVKKLSGPLKITGLFKVAILFSAVFGITNGLLAQSSGGGYGESYLQRDIGARQISMGGVNCAISNDATAIFYNPAGLSWLSGQPSFMTTYSFLDFGRSHMAAAWGQNFFENFGFGAGINSFSTGTFTARDIRGVPIGDLADRQISLSAGGSYLIDYASIGGSVKYLSHTLTGADFSANGFSMDLGAKFNVMDMFSFGVAVQNFAGVMSWNQGPKEDNLLPFTLRAGVAMEFGLNDEFYTARSTVSGELENIYEPATQYILVAVDAVLIQHEAGPALIVGIEGAPHEIVAFRAGMNILGDELGAYKLFPMTIWGGGVSLRPDFPSLPFNLNIDYSVAQDHISLNSISHHISLYFEMK